MAEQALSCWGLSERISGWSSRDPRSLGDPPAAPVLWLRRSAGAISTWVLPACPPGRQGLSLLTCQPPSAGERCCLQGTSLQGTSLQLRTSLNREFSVNPLHRILPVGCKSQRFPDQNFERESRILTVLQLRIFFLNKHLACLICSSYPGPEAETSSTQDEISWDILSQLLHQDDRRVWSVESAPGHAYQGFSAPGVITVPLSLRPLGAVELAFSKPHR